MFEQTLFQLVDRQKKFVIFDEEFFIIFYDDRNDFINHDDI